MKRLVILIFAVILVFFPACSAISNSPEPSTTDDSLMIVARNSWLSQSGVGMFFGTGIDKTNSVSNNPEGVLCAIVDPALAYQDKYGQGTLNVNGLDSQFPDNIPLYLKFTCPNWTFGSSILTFRIEKVLNSTNGQYVTQLVKEFNIAVDPNAGIVRFAMPDFSIGPGIYLITAITNGQQRLTRPIKYLAANEKHDPNFVGY